MVAYWMDPITPLRDFDPEINEFDKSVYNYVVPNKRRKSRIISTDLGSVNSDLIDV